MKDEESDDDSYWDQFDQSENEVDATDHRQDEVSSEPAGDYFDIMEQQCLIREETVAGENDIVWKRVLQSEERGWIKSTQALKCVESELKDTVPHSIMVHTELKNILSGKFDDFYELWVDKVNDPELIMLFTESWEFCGSTIHLFGDPGVCSKKLTTLMFNVVRDFEAKHPDRSQQFALECVDQGIAEEFISLLERKERKVLQVVYAGTFASPYARPTPDCHCIAPIDTDRYKIDSVKVEDAELINSTWKYRGDTSLREIRKVIQKYPGVCIRTTTNELAAWCLTYPYGAFGMMYTLPEHRKQGLGKRIVLELMNKSLEDASASNHMMYAHIEDDNVASKTMFCGPAIGFERVQDVVWMTFQL